MEVQPQANNSALAIIEQQIHAVAAVHGYQSEQVGSLCLQLGKEVAQMGTEAAGPEKCRDAIRCLTNAINCFGGKNNPRREVLEALVAYANIVRGQSDPEQTIAILSHLVTLCRQKSSPDTWTSEELFKFTEYMTEIGNLHHNQGRLRDARPWLEQSLKWRRECPSIGPHHMDTARSMNNLAALLFDQSEYDQSMLLLEDALKIVSACPEKDTHPSYSSILNNLASVYEKVGRPKEAVSMMQMALEIETKLYGPEHIEVARTRNNYAVLLKSLGRLEEARTYLENAVGVKMRSLGSNHAEIALGLHNLAEIYREKGEGETALALHKQALEIKEEVHPKLHPAIGDSLHCLAVVYFDLEMFSEAEQAAVRCLDIQLKSRGPEHPDAILARHNRDVIKRRLAGGPPGEELASCFEKLKM